MSGSTKQFYAYPETLKIIDSLEKGELSHICNQAILEHNGSILSLESIRKKLDILLIEKNLIETKIEFLKDREKVLIKREREESEEKERIQQIKEKKIEDKLKSIKENIRFFYGLNDSQLLSELSTEYLNSDAKTFFEFMSNKGYQQNQEKETKKEELIENV